MGGNVFNIDLLPSNRVDAQEASELATELIEEEIRLDYLSETHKLPVEAVRITIKRGVMEWWDSLEGLASYAKIMAQRHKKPTEDEWRTSGPKRPDLSTFNGPSYAKGPSRRNPFGEAEYTRREIYEIKPDNDDGRNDPRTNRGWSAAREKLKEIEDRYRDARLSGIYKRGETYPKGILKYKEIKMSAKKVEVARYLLTLWLKPLGIRIEEVSLVLRRPEAGVLLYRIRVRMRAERDLAVEEQWRIANLTMLVLSEVNVVGTETQKRRIERDKRIRRDLRRQRDPVVTWVPVPNNGKGEQEIQWVVDGKDFRVIPFLRTRPIEPLADPIKPVMQDITTAMYSRLIGQPGQRFMMLGDEDWYNANVRWPGELNHRGYASAVSLTKSMLTRSQFAGATAFYTVRTSELLRLLSPEQRAQLIQRFPNLATFVQGAEEAGRVAVHVLIGLAIIATVAAITIATAGAASAPVGVGVGAGASAGIEATVLTSGAVVAQGGSGALGMSAGTIEAALGSEAAAAGLPEAVAGGAGGSAGSSTVAAQAVSAQIQQALATGQTAAEIQAIAADKAVLDMLAKIFAEAVKLSEKVAVPAGLALVAATPAINYARAAALVGTQPSLKGALDQPSSPSADRVQADSSPWLPNNGHMGKAGLMAVGSVYILPLSTLGKFGQDAPNGRLQLYDQLTIGGLKLRKLGVFEVY